MQNKLPWKKRNGWSLECKTNFHGKREMGDLWNAKQTFMERKRVSFRVGDLQMQSCSMEFRIHSRHLLLNAWVSDLRTEIKLTNRVVQAFPTDRQRWIWTWWRCSKLGRRGRGRRKEMMSAAEAGRLYKHCLNFKTFGKERVG
jgi:hypothetical protein